MLNIRFPVHVEDRPLVFFLAAEEYLARNSDEDCFLLWQVGPTVIFGRNQVMEAEVNVPFCKEHGIRMFRRKSGGGCVYADRGNLMISAVSSGNDKPFIFEKFISALALALRRQGFDAWPSGRNDILVSGRKVSGSAFYSIGSRNIIHATLLCDVNLDMMQNAVTPPPEKLRKKGIASVRQRVENLSAFSPADIAVIRESLAGFFCDGERLLSDTDIGNIERIAESYMDENFILYGKISHKNDDRNI